MPCGLSANVGFRALEVGVGHGLIDRERSIEDLQVHGDFGVTGLAVVASIVGVPEADGRSGGFLDVLVHVGWDGHCGHGPEHRCILEQIGDVHVRQIRVVDLEQVS